MPISSSSSDLALAYLRNMQAAQASGQADHAAFLLKHALTWLGRHERECVLATDSPVRFDVGIGLHAGKNPSRVRNEDYVFAEQVVRSADQETVGVFCLADGAGGHANGQEASRTAVHAFVDAVWHQLIEEDVRGDALKDLLLKGMWKANYAVWLQNQNSPFSATTCTAVLTVGTEVVIANVGDSRTYLYRPGVGLRAITCDHSVVGELVASGVILPEEVYTHPERNKILRCLGATANVEVDVFYEQLQDGDVLLLCSDGLWEMVRDPKAKAIQAILSNHHRDASGMAKALVDLALQSGGLDNIGLITVRHILTKENIPTISLPSPVVVLT